MSNKPSKDVSSVTNMLGTLSKDVVQSSKNETVDAKALKKANEKLAVTTERLETVEKQLESALVSQGDGSWLLFGEVRLTKLGLVEIPDKFSDDDRHVLGEIILGLQEATQFWMGDWANLYITDNMSNQERGVVYKNLAAKFEVNAETLMDFALVCRNLPFPLRQGNATFSHHREVAYLPDSLKGRETEFLEKAIDNKWTVRDLRDEIKEAAKTLSESGKALPDTIIDTKPMKKEFNDVTRVFRSDVSDWSPKKRNEYRGKIVALRRLLDDAEAKLDD